MFRCATLLGIGVSLLVITPRVSAQNPDLQLEMTSGIVATGGEVRLTNTLSTLLDGISGWSWSVCHDPSLVTVTDVETSEFVETAKDGAPPDFHVISIHGDGWYVGAVLSAYGCCVLPVGVHEMYYPEYQAGSQLGVTDVQFCDTIGEPPVAVCLVIQGNCEFPIRVDGEIEVVTELPFQRGDCNQDGNLDLADVIYSELYLFTSGEEPGCLTACDNNDDGILDIADPIYLLNTLFVGGPPVPEPNAECGFQATQDELGCQTYACP